MTSAWRALVRAWTLPHGHEPVVVFGAVADAPQDLRLLRRRNERTDERRILGPHDDESRTRDGHLRRAPALQPGLQCVVVRRHVSLANEQPTTKAIRS